MKSTYTTRYGDEVTISRPTYDIQKDLDELVDYYMPPLERDMESLQDRPTERDLIEPTELRNKFYNIYVRMSQWLINSFYAKIRVKDFSIKKASGEYIIPEFECFIDTSETPIKGGDLDAQLPDKTNCLKIGFNLVYKERQSVVAKVEYTFTHNWDMQNNIWVIPRYLKHILGPYYRAVKDKQKSELEIAEIYKKTRSDIFDVFFQKITSAVLTYDSSEAQISLIIYIIRAAYNPTSLYFDKKMMNTHSVLDTDTDYMPFISKYPRYQADSYTDDFFEDFTKKGSIVFSNSIESLKSGCEMTTFEMTSTCSFKATLREPSICWRYGAGGMSKYIYYYIPVFLSNTARSCFWEKYANRDRKTLRLGFFLDDGSGDFIKNIKTERYKKEMIDIHLPMVEKDIYIEVLFSSEQGDKKDILAVLAYNNPNEMFLLKVLCMCNKNINLASFFEQSEKFEKETQKTDPTYSYFGHGFNVLKNLYPKTERSSIHLKYRKISGRKIGTLVGILKSRDQNSMEALQKEIVRFLSNN